MSFAIIDFKHRAMAISLLAMLAILGSARAGNSSPTLFLRRARQPQKVKTWARLSGVMVNKTRGRKRKRSDIQFSLRFTEEMILAQIVVGDSAEVYSIGQAYNGKSKEASVVREKGKGKNSVLMRDYGIRPEDMTMSFLFWKFKLELPKTSIKGQVCRVFLLAKPNSDKIAKVYISEEYYFPLKVEWALFRNGKLTDPSRTLEVDSFKKVSGLWLIDSLLFYGPGWKTKILFSQCEAGYVADGTPDDLFKVK